MRGVWSPSVQVLSRPSRASGLRLRFLTCLQPGREVKCCPLAFVEFFHLPGASRRWFRSLKGSRVPCEMSP